MLATAETEMLAREKTLEMRAALNTWIAERLDAPAAEFRRIPRTCPGNSHRSPTTMRWARAVAQGVRRSAAHRSMASLSLPEELAPEALIAPEPGMPIEALEGKTAAHLVVVPGECPPEHEALPEAVVPEADLAGITILSLVEENHEDEIARAAREEQGVVLTRLVERAHATPPAITTTPFSIEAMRLGARTAYAATLGEMTAAVAGNPMPAAAAA